MVSETKLVKWWSGASDGFFKKFEHAKDTFGKLKGKVAGLQDKFRQFIMDKLPEKDRSLRGLFQMQFMIGRSDWSIYTT